MPLLVYFLCVAAFGVVLTSAAYPVAGPALGLEYHKLLFRCLELGGLVCVFAWMHLIGARGLGAWGWSPPLAARMRDLGAGWALGVMTLAVVVGGLIAFGARGAGALPGLGPAIVLVLKGLTVGFAVAVVEELWFRGALLTALAGSGGERRWRAAAWTSILFAAVHFIRPDRPVAAHEVGWWSAPVVLAGSFGRFADPGILDTALALVAAGGLLAIVRIHTGSVALCIGIHAGWVNAIYVARKLTALRAEHPASALAGDYDGVVGWFAAAVFALTALILHRRLGRRARGGPPPGLGPAVDEPSSARLGAHR